MRGSELLDRMELVDPMFIEAAESAGVSAARRRYWRMPLAVAAACLAVVLPAALRFGRPELMPPADSGTALETGPSAESGSPAEIDPNIRNASAAEGNSAAGSKQPSNSPSGNPALSVGSDPSDNPALSVDPSLPKLTIGMSYEGMGYEGYFAYSPEELTDTCPWNETITLESLPVFKNKYQADRAGYSPEADELLKKAEIIFDPPAELPEDLHFGFYSSYEELTAVGEYLKTAYAGELNMEKPILDIRGGGRSIYGMQKYDLYFYEGAGDITDRLLSWNLSKQQFSCNGEGKLLRITKSIHGQNDEKVGDYPLITAAEARELLCRGNYITSSPFAMAGEEYIVRTELVYQTRWTEEYFMPYYRFLAETPEDYYGRPKPITPETAAIEGFPVSSPSAEYEDLPDDGTGMKSYSVYYVPAVRPEYLTEMPVWGSSFN